MEGEEGWRQGLDKTQRKRLRQRAKKKAEPAAGEGRMQEDGGGDEEGEEEDDGADMDIQQEEPVRPFQPPPLPRRLCVQQAESLQRKVEQMQLDGKRPQLIERAERRLEQAKKMVREAGGPTERRLVFSILQEETKEGKLREAISIADKEVEERERGLLEAQRGLDEAKRKRADLQAKWQNSKARVAFLAAEKAAETVPQDQTAAVHEALQSILAGAAPGLQAQARLVSDYFRAVAPVPARVPEDKFFDLSDGETQDEGEAMEEVEHQRQGVKRQLGGQLVGQGLLPAPARDASSLEEAKDELARLRHQKLTAISAAFNRKSMEVDQLPVMSPSELSDRFDQELQRALEQVRRHSSAQAEESDPTPCPPSTAAGSGGVAVAAAEGGGREGGLGERGGIGGGDGQDGNEGRKAAKVAEEGNERCEGPAGYRSNGRGAAASTEAAAVPERTQWEQNMEGGAAGEAGVRGAGPQRELEWPGCGRSLVAPQALTGSCECGAAVCIECSEGGIVINNCLVCFEKCESAMVEDVDAGAAAAIPPGPLEFVGTLTGDLQGKPAAARRASP